MRLLSTLLLASAVSAWPSWPGKASSVEERQNIPKTLIDPSLWPTFVYYTTFAAASQLTSCPKPPYGTVIQSYLHNPVTNVSGTLYRSDNTSQFILGYQGTQGEELSLENMAFALVPWVAPGVNLTNCAGCLVSAGFLLDWLSIYNATNVALSAATAAYPNYTTIIVGHSLGGAIATLAYASLKGKGYNIPQIYTMGQPRVGNAAHANYIDNLSGASELVIGNFYRLTHTYDDAPQLPPQNLTYQHSRTEFWQLNNTMGNQAANLTYRCYGQEPYDCNDSTYYLNQAQFAMANFTANSQHAHYSNIDFKNTAQYCN